MRKIEERIITAINKHETVTLSKRDYVDNVEGEMHVTLHRTRIAVVQEHSVIINTGGWHTNTTKSRLNAILGAFTNYGIYQKDFAWLYEERVNGQRKAIGQVIDGMRVPRIR